MNVIELAKSQVGVKRGRSHEDDVRIREYLGNDPRERNLRLNYCSAFILWLFKEAGTPLPGNFWRNRACGQLQRELERAGARVSARWKQGDPPLEPGDIFFLERALDVPDQEHMIPVGWPGHVGLVVQWKNSGFQSIEGNVSHEVKQLMRNLPHRNFLAAYRWPKE